MQTTKRLNTRVDFPHLHERHNSVDKAVYDLEACGGPHVGSHQAAAVPRAGVAGVVAKNDIRNLEKPYAVLDLKTFKVHSRPHRVVRIALIVVVKALC